MYKTISHGEGGQLYRGGLGPMILVYMCTGVHQSLMVCVPYCVSGVLMIWISEIYVGTDDSRL